MHIVEQLFHRHKEKTTLGFCVLFSLVLLILPSESKFYLARKSLNAIFLPWEKLVHVLDDFRELRGENRRLKRIVASLRLEREKLLQFKAERERLRRLAAFKEEQFFKLLPCEVIGRNFDHFQTVLVIDKGKSDSLKARMPVLSYQGYVGRILEVFPNSSWVQLICSRNSPVSCLDKRSRVVGILEWKEQSYFELKNVSIVEDIQFGDTLITSGFGGVVPKGFPVAVVTKVAKAIDELSFRVDARSHIRFRSLEEVFVVVGEIPWENGIIYDEKDAELLEGTSEEVK